MNSDEDFYQYSEEEYDDEEEEEEEEDFKKSPLKNNRSSLAPTPMSSSSIHSSSAYNKGEGKYIILDTIRLLEEQQKVIIKCQELLAISYHNTQLVLIQYRWNPESLMNDFFEKGIEYVLQQSGVANNNNNVNMNNKNNNYNGEGDCAICFDELSYETSAINPGCGHTFCLDCWRGQISAKISEGKSRRIPCGMHKCSAALDADLIYRVLNDPKQDVKSLRQSQQDKARYEKSMLDSFVEDNPRARWCPSLPCCGRAVKVSESSSVRVDCECLSPCDEVFCFQCGDPTHTPTPCEWAKLWLQKCASESENANYILANCKPCPNCKKQIQKGDGCNHVTCVCGQCMCWLCGAATGRAHDARSIVGHTCDKFRIKDGLSSSAKEQLDRYLHYFQKYEIHMQSLRKAKEKERHVSFTIEQLNSKVSLTNTTTTTSKEEDDEEEEEDMVNLSTITSNSQIELADWLWIGLKQLFRMRRFIAWTYAFSYYAFFEENGAEIRRVESKDPIKNVGGYFYQSLFEDLQTQLQNSIEELSKNVEMKAGDMDTQTKPKVLALCNATHQQAANLWKFVDNDILTISLAKFCYPSPNVYFPIRRMVTGLGAKTIEDQFIATSTSSSSSSIFKTNNNNNKATTTTTSSSFMVDEKTINLIDRSKKAKGCSLEKKTELIDLTGDQEEEEEDHHKKMTMTRKSHYATKTRSSNKSRNASKKKE